MPKEPSFRTPRSLVSWTLFIGLLLLAAGFASTWTAPLSGVHGIRQADTLFAGWSYCVEGAEFLRPRVAHRGTGAGVVIGEFPLASAVFALPCRLTGQWSEGAVELVVVLIFLLNTLAWGAFVRRRWPDRWPGWPWFTLIWVFSTHALLHFTIALPDALALTLIAGAGLAFLSAEERTRPHLGRLFARIGGVALFTIAFGMRPYLVPLLLLVIPGWLWRAFAFGACVAFYLVWYKWWILQSEFYYYATGVTSGAEIWQRAPEILMALLEAAIRNAANVIGVVFLYLGWRTDRDRFLWLLLLGSIAFVMLRAPMIISHKYYLGAACVILAILMIHGARRAPAWTAVIFLLVAIVNVQHHWRGGARELARQVQAEVERNGVGPKDLVAVYAGDSSSETRYLYWAKRFGWTRYTDQYRGPTGCPEGATWLMIVRDDVPKIERCQR